MDEKKRLTELERKKEDEKFLRIYRATDEPAPPSKISPQFKKSENYGASYETHKIGALVHTPSVPGFIVNMAKGNQKNEKGDKKKRHVGGKPKPRRRSHHNSDESGDSNNESGSGSSAGESGDSNDEKNRRHKRTHHRKKKVHIIITISVANVHFSKAKAYSR